jgi:hypothetical protein
MNFGFAYAVSCTFPPSTRVPAPVQNGNYDYPIIVDCIEGPKREPPHQRTANRVVNHSICRRLVRNSC